MQILIEHLFVREDIQLIRDWLTRDMQLTVSGLKQCDVEEG